MTHQTLLKHLYQNKTFSETDLIHKISLIDKVLVIRLMDVSFNRQTAFTCIQLSSRHSARGKIAKLQPPRKIETGKSFIQGQNQSTNTLNDWKTTVYS